MEGVRVLGDYVLGDRPLKWLLVEQVMGGGLVVRGMQELGGYLGYGGVEGEVGARGFVPQERARRGLLLVWKGLRRWALLLAAWKCCAQASVILAESRRGHAAAQLDLSGGALRPLAALHHPFF